MSIPAPTPPDEAARLVELHSYAILDTPSEAEFDGFTRLAANLFGVPIALISLVDNERQWFKSRYGLGVAETPREDAFCSHAILSDSPMVVADASADPRFHDNPLVTGDPNIRFYAGAPLISPAGHRLGTICVIDQEIRQPTSTLIAALGVLSRQVVTQLELRKKLRELEEERELKTRAFEASAAAEGRLAESERRFRALSEHAPIGIYHTDIEGSCLYTNPAWQHIAGLSAAESLGDGWQRAIHPEDSAGVFAEWQAAVAEGREFSKRFRFRTAAGEVRLVSSRASALRDDQGAITGFVGTVEDITEWTEAQAALRSREERLQRVLEGSSDGFWDWRVDTGHVEFSDRLAEMVGYEPGEMEPHVRSWEGLIHPDDRQAVMEVLEGHLSGFLPHYSSEHRLRTKDGRWIWILDRGKAVLRDASGRALRVAGTRTDITDRKRAEQELARFFAVSLDPLCIAGMDGYYKRINPAFEKLLGYSTSEILSTPFLDFVHPEDGAKTLQAFEGLTRGELLVRFENRLLTRTGETRWVAWVASPYVEEQVIYAAARDITLAKETALALEASDERHRDILDNATDLIQSVGPDGRFLYVNRAWRTALGYTEETAGLRMAEVIHPDHLQHCQETLERLLTGQPVSQLETVFVSKNGEPRVVEGNVSCRFENGIAVSTRGIFRDVTERKVVERALARSHETVRQREAAMRAMADSALSGIVTFDGDGRIASVNPAAEQIIGYAPEDLLGKTVGCLLADPLSDEDYRDLVRRSLGRVTEIDLRRADGTIIPAEVSLFEFDPGDGKQFACYVQDVSRRREVERLKQEFISTVSHELRTPLTSIRGSLDLLDGGALGALAPPAEEVVAIALRNTTRLIKLINEILDLDRLQSGTLEFSFATVPVAELLQSACDAVRSFAAENGVAVRVEPSDDSVQADPERLLQVIINLLSNAIKFSPAGSEVVLRTGDDADHVAIEVEDHGSGIPPHFLDRIFDRFQQVDATDSRARNGSGLGLAISKAIVAQHRGFISVRSELGKGSTFTILLPRARLHAAAQRDVLPILVAVSEPATQSWLTATLEANGFPALRATSAEDVPPLQSISAAIVELRSGASRVLEALRRERDDLPIVVLARDAPAGAPWLRGNTAVLLEATPDRLLGAVERFVQSVEGRDVVLVEDDAALAGVIGRQLRGDGVRIRTAGSGSEGIALIRARIPQLVILDVGLPDIDGFDVVAILRENEATRRLPLLIYTGRDLAEHDRHRLTLGPTHFLTKARATDDEFRRMVAGILGKGVSRS